MRRPIPWLLALGSLIGTGMARAQVIASPTAVPGIVEGASAPEIDLPVLGGGRVTLKALRGRPVVVTFWGTWCPPCRDEFPALVSAHQKYRGQGLEVIAVNQRDQELKTGDVEAFAKEYGVDFTVALDARGRSRRTFRLVALPTTVFIDAEGVMRTIHSGPIGARDLARGLETILPAR